MRRLFALYIVSIAFFYYYLVPSLSVTKVPWLVGMVLLAATALRIWRSGVVPRPGPIGLVLVLFVVGTALNGAVQWIRAPWTIPDWVTSAAQYLFNIAIVFAFAVAGLTATEIGRLCKVWVWTAGAAAAFAIYQTFARVLELPQPETFFTSRGFTGMVVKTLYGFPSASSWFGEPSWLGSFLVVPLVYVVGVSLLDPPEPYRFSPRVTRGLLAVILIALFLSLSQAAYMTVLLVSVPLIWSLRHQILIGRALRFTALAGALVVGLAVLFEAMGAEVFRAQVARLFAVVDAWRHPESTLQISSYGERMFNMIGGIQMWSESPIVGVGINSVQWHPSASRLLQAYQWGGVHSGLLQLLVEQGILGFGTLMVAFVMIWKRLRRVHVEDPDPGHRFLAWFLMWGLVTELVNSIATHPWQHAQHWLIVSLAVAFLAYMKRQRPLEAG